MAAVSCVALSAMILGLCSYVWQLTRYNQFLSAYVGRYEREKDTLEKTTPLECLFMKKQHTRRCRISILITLVGAMMPVAHYFLPIRPKFGCFLWSLVLIFLGLIIMYAILDALSTHIYFLHIKNEFLIEHAKLKAKLEKKKRELKDMQ